MTRSIDTAPHPEFRCYSAGNFAEVAPARWSVMSWSLVGDPVERGLRAFTQRLLPTARWATGSNYVFVGYFNCRPYHNLSALCHLAHELPAFEGADVTRDYFEGVEPPRRELRAHASALQRTLAVPRMAREFHRLRPRLSGLEADVALCEEQVETALHAGSALALGAAMERALGMLDSAWDVHYSTTSSLVPAGALQRKLGRRLLPAWDEVERLVNKPDELPWGRLFDASIDDAHFLRAPFYEVADAFEPWHGFAHAFTPQPAGDVPAPEGDDIAEVVWQMYRGLRKVGIEQLTRAVNDNLQAREESKSLAMRALHVFRRVLPALAVGGGAGRRRVGLPAHPRAARAALPRPAWRAGRDASYGVRRGARRRDARRVQRAAPGGARPAACAGAPAGAADPDRRLTGPGQRRRHDDRAGCGRRRARRARDPRLRVRRRVHPEPASGQRRADHAARQHALAHLDARPRVRHPRDRQPPAGRDARGRPADPAQRQHR